jgi:diguanylate cyclase (GGDEF)-like protein
LREAELPFAIVHVDVDHLRRYNDQYGQPRGDRILKALSQFLQARLREDDLIGRLSDGDEFVIALTATAEQALAVGRRLVTSLRRSDRDGQTGRAAREYQRRRGRLAQTWHLGRHVLDAARLATRLAKARGRGQCLLAEGPPPATEYEEEVRDTL